MTKKIKFIKASADFPDIYSPVPASSMIPDWYKAMESYRKSDKHDYSNHESKPSTIKKCMPVFDSISSGYLIKLHSDISIKYENGEYLYKTAHPEPSKILEFHPKFQASLYPKDLKKYAAIPKIINHWGIKTPKGYSCLIIPPSHHENIIKILPGIVDTDSYNSPVHFPFLIDSHEFSGVIKAGTPVAQVIPFKRDHWKKEIIEDFGIINRFNEIIMSVFYNGYKTIFWNKKEFK